MLNSLFLSSIGSFLIIALVYWFMPYVTPKTVIFGIRIPPSREGDTQISDLRHSYHLMLLGGSAVIFLAAVILPAYYNQYFLSMTGMFFEIVFSYLAYYRANRKLEHIKTSQGWYNDLKQSIGAVYTEDDLKAKSWERFLFIIPSFVIIAVTVYIGIMTYPSLPNPLPTHFGANGQPNGYSAKTIGSAFLTVFMQIGVTVMMLIIGVAISRTKQEIDVSRPLETMIQQDRFKYYTTSGLYLFQGLINLTLMFSSFSIWQIMSTKNTLIFTLAPVLAGSAILTVVLMNAGQMGSRLDVHVTESPTGVVNRNDDKYWIGGALYYNKEDKSILVGKRFGVGWTFNFGHPVTWVILAAIVAVPILTALLSTHAI